MYSAVAITFAFLVFSVGMPVPRLRTQLLLGALSVATQIGVDFAFLDRDPNDFRLLRPAVTVRSGAVCVR